MRRLPALLFPALAVTLGAGAALWREVPRTVPNDVAELAPGVFFRHGDLQAHGHCNNGIILFRDYVLVVDGNFPSGAEACLADVSKRTGKPVRFVFDTHHHGDHAYGNPVWVKAGAVPVAHEGVAREMARLEPGRWQEAMGRDDIKATGLSSPVPPQITFPEKMILDDGTRRVELLHFGTAHTRGDGFAYLPREKVLFTGDAVVNGPHNFMGDGNTESWIEVLDALLQLDVEVVAPGHGPLGDKGLIADQRLYIASLREAVAAGLKAEEPLEKLIDSVRSRVPEKVQRYIGGMFKDQVAKIRSEMLGLEMPLELERLGLAEGPPSPRREGTPPARVVYAGPAEHLPALRAVAPGVEVVVPVGREAFLRAAADADALIGGISPETVAAGKRLRWVHSFSAGVEEYVGLGNDRTPGIAALVASDVVLTNGRRAYGPNIADQVFAYLLSFTRRVKDSIEGKAGGGGGVGTGTGTVAGKNARWGRIDPASEEIELRGKTMVLVGAGGIGSEVAERAAAFGMTVIAIDPALKEPPRGVSEIHAPAALREHLPRADVLVLACPLTRATIGLIGERELAALRDGAYLINVARGRIVDPAALVAALRSGKLAGAGLDVTEPEPLPDSSPLWDLPNVIITPHNAGQADGSTRRRLLLARENLRRFAAGLPLLNVVDKAAGF